MLTHMTGDSCLKTEWAAESQGIQMHYIPSIFNGKSTLSVTNRPHRFNEYFERFKQLRKLYPADTKLFGYSWLYNLQIYTWLFPPFASYFSKDGKQLKSVETVDCSVGERIYPHYDPRYVQGKTRMQLNSWAVWGQFLQKGYQSSSEQIEGFMNKVNTASNISGLIDAFPHPTRYYENTLITWWLHLRAMQVADY